MDVQQAASAQVVEGCAGGGMVTVQLTGGMDIVNVTIDPSVVDPADVEMLQDLVLAAMRDAVARANDLNRQALGGLGLGGGLEGLIGG
jgi:DNA-binding YbaB/EbfC family protein